MSTNQHSVADDSTATTSATDTTQASTGKGAIKKRKRLSPAEIAQRREQRQPGIARAKAAETAPVRAADQASEAPTIPADMPPEPSGNLRVAPVVELVYEAVLDRDPAPATTVRQMTLWENHEDPDVVAEWAAATAIVHPIDGDAVDESEADTGAGDGQDTGSGAARGRGKGRLRLVTDVAGQAERRSILSALTVQYDAHLVPDVRPAVVDLVMEHPRVSAEADKHMTWLGIRFGIWSLTKTADGVFDPYRDLTENRINGYLRYLGSSVSEASKDSYASGLRRLAAGPPQRRVGKRRIAVAPHTVRAEDGFWTAADVYDPHSVEHTEGKTLLAATFGAGALPEEVNLLDPRDVLVARGRVSLRLRRDPLDSREVPVTEDRYAHWLVDRAVQLRGERFLFQPRRASRRNTVNATTSRLRQTNAIFERYSTSAARNAWFARLLTAGIPFQIACTAAGVGPGTHLPTDLLPHLPVPDPADIEAVIRARMTPPQTP
jgi:hypothetical protein